MLKNHHKKALILGTGGASKAIAYALKKNKIKYKFVSRKPEGKKEISYDSLTQELPQNYLIVNCTPLGTFPNIQEFPNIPYQYLTEDHLAFDLTYNPRETKFIQRKRKRCYY